MLHSFRVTKAELEKCADSADASALFFKLAVLFFASVCAKHALNNCAGKLSCNTDPGIYFKDSAE